MAFVCVFGAFSCVYLCPREPVLLPVCVCGCVFSLQFESLPTVLFDGLHLQCQSYEKILFLIVVFIHLIVMRAFDKGL